MVQQGVVTFGGAAVPAGRRRKQYRAEQILLALGRQANTDRLGLEQLWVQLTGTGAVVVDSPAHRQPGHLRSRGHDNPAGVRVCRRRCRFRPLVLQGFRVSWPGASSLLVSHLMATPRAAKNAVGSTALAGVAGYPVWVSRCRCGPEECPLLPTWPMTCPVPTGSPWATTGSTAKMAVSGDGAIRVSQVGVPPFSALDLGM